MAYIGKWLLGFSIEAFLPIEPPTEVTLRNAAISLVVVFLSVLWLCIRLKELAFLLDI